MKNNEFRLHGVTLRTLRNIYDIKRNDLADLLGIRPEQISKAENHQRKLTREQTLLVLSEIDVSENTAIEIERIIQEIKDRSNFDKIKKRLGR